MAWTNQQIADFIEMGCADFISTARNNIVLSTYLGEFRTNMTKSIFLRPLPVLECDQPRIRRKNLYEMYSIPQYSSLAYDLIRRSGELIFRFNQLYVNAGEPFDMDNEVRVTFRSGYPQIPKEVQKCVLLVAASINNPPRGLESLGGGSLKAKWRDPKKELYRIYQPVRKYIMTEQRA
jgi:hypothetical protein